ncbi:hypothetical protein CEXT_428791 [Caerostris extrusa]|uniref:Uncharacterized protein n=1 Tax=Caerostris extrusa TaxID=172846 RepID=A0AAV4Q1J7_CAEEX|nr:hypothetical protein CEXT_428791 [Caerostris extrusa]
MAWLGFAPATQSCTSQRSPSKQPSRHIQEAAVRRVLHHLWNNIHDTVNTEEMRPSMFNASEGCCDNTELFIRFYKTNS